MSITVASGVISIIIGELEIHCQFQAAELSELLEPSGQEGTGSQVFER